MSKHNETRKFFLEELGIQIKDGYFFYELKGCIGKEQNFSDKNLYKVNCQTVADEIIIKGSFKNSNIELHQVFRNVKGAIEENITLINKNSEPVQLENISMGFITDMANRSDLRLCAIPFRVQLDGSLHEYTTEMLINGVFKNAVCTDDTRIEPPLAEDCLWSEAWVLSRRERGLVIIKYNNDNIELSVARSVYRNDAACLVFGGAGLSLYGEPTIAKCLKPGESFTFGTTVYVPFTGKLEKAYAIYRSFLDSKGHTFPQNYDPPVNWNVLYDVGWHHSDPEKLKQYYSKESILKEAGYAKECGCELLYLDPGWEIEEGSTLWDETRLGPVKDLVGILKTEYGLDLGYRTILHCHDKYFNRELWPNEFMVKQYSEEDSETIENINKLVPGICLSNMVFWKEKLRRILEISKQGIRFMMFDEMDWRGSCYDEKHNHRIPTVPLDHVNAVYALAKEVKRQYPEILTEVHDSVWPWHTSVYIPTYFRQGFDDKGCYDENWGFEYMWNCIEDLKSGKALALYYYNLGCNIPLYLHITMAADNDNCLFFWWAASTIRHLGIGGKEGHESINPPVLPPYDKAKRYASYIEQMKIYKRLKKYFARGTFYGINENVHLHTLSNVKGGVVNVFNLTEDEKEYEFTIPFDLLGGKDIMVDCYKAEWTEEGLKFNIRLPAMSPIVICIGDAYCSTP